MRRLAFLFWAATLTLAAQITVIKSGRIIDGTGAPARIADIVIHGDRIESVTTNAPVPAGARIVDAAGKSVLPGFFDLHTHLTASSKTGEFGDWEKNAAAYLAAGVTTVNDFAEYSEMYAPMRDLLAHQVKGPHVHFAARFSTPGGHGTEGGWGDTVTLTAGTPEEGRARIRTALTAHPDLIKIFTDGWRYGTAPDLTSMNFETLAAMVEEAHVGGVKVFTHTVTLAGAKIAARAGVDALAHGVGDKPIDAELISLLKAKGTFYIPTLAVFESHVPHETPQHAARWRNLLDSVRRLHEAGVPVAVGTDAGMPGTPHGASTLHEIELYASDGFTGLEALAAGTSVAARALGIEAERGTITPGKFADLVLINGRPDENIKDIEKTEAVFRDGEQITPAQPDPQRIQTIGPLVDQMKRILGTTDAGPDHSTILFTPVRGGSLMVMAHMSAKADPYARVEFPLTPGAVEPADVTPWSSVSFDVRGGPGSFRLLGYLSSARKPKYIAAPFEATGEWKTITIPFAALHNPKTLNSLAFEMSGPPDTTLWLELDNIKFK